MQNRVAYPYILLKILTSFQKKKKYKFISFKNFRKKNIYIFRVPNVRMEIMSFYSTQNVRNSRKFNEILEFKEIRILFKPFWTHLSQEN